MCNVYVLCLENNQLKNTLYFGIAVSCSDRYAALKKKKKKTRTKFDKAAEFMHPVRYRAVYNGDTDLSLVTRYFSVCVFKVVKGA